MRVLYITSGFTQSYPHQFIDRFITTSFNALSGQQIQVFQLNPSLPNWGGRLVAMVRRFKPDYIFTIHGGYLSKNLVQTIKDISHATLGIWFIDDPYDIHASKQRLWAWDYIFTNELSAVPVYKKLGYRQVYYLPLGVQTQIYYPETVTAQYYSDICFVGSPFPKRVQFIKHLQNKFSNLKIKVIGPHWQKYLHHRTDLISHPLAPEEIRKYYNGAKINLNIHRDDTEHIDGINLNPEGINATSPNNRIFDICACNSFQLVDYRPGLRDYFNLKNDLITFNDTSDLVTKIQHYLNNHTLRKYLATAGYKKVLAEHRMEARIQEMIQIIQRNLQHEGRLPKSRPNTAPRSAQPDKQGNDSRQVGHSSLNLSELENQVVKGDRPAIYLIQSGQKHLIPNTHTFQEYGFRWEDLRMLPQNLVDQIPDGEPLS